MKTLSLIAVGVASLLGVTACASSAPKSSDTKPSATVAAGSTTPVGGSATATTAKASSGVTPTKECAAFLAAMAGAFTTERKTLGDLPVAFDKLSGVAPSELKADFAIVSATYAKLVDIVKQAGNDPAKYAKDPVALGLFSDPKFMAAIARVSAYTDKTCPKK